MATTVASGVTMSLGLLTCMVSMTSAVEPKTSNTNVCTGVEKEHDVTKIQSRNHCAVCGEVPYSEIKKARAVGDGYVLLTAEELADATTDATRYKKAAALTAHPAEDVDLNTVNGDKLYYLTPSAGSEPVYAVLYALVVNHPELTFVTQWTPRSKAGLFALKAFNDTLCLQERVRTEGIRQAPEVSTEAPEAMLALAEQFITLTGLVQNFDPETYADTFEARIAEIVASKTPTSMVVPGSEATTPVVVTGTDAMTALQAMIDAAAPKPAAKTRARKTA